MLGNEMFKFPEGVVSRWASYENPDGAKGAGGKERNGRKGVSAESQCGGRRQDHLYFSDRRGTKTVGKI